MNRQRLTNASELPKPITASELHKLRYHAYHTLKDFYPPELLKMIRDRWRNLPMQDIVRTHNVFHVKKYRTQEDREIKEAMDDLAASYGLENKTHYVYEYTAGSHTKLHGDAPGTVTFVTLIEPNTAKGGDALILDKHRITIDKSWCGPNGELPPNILEHEVHDPRPILYVCNTPRILPLKNVGDTLFYPNATETKHGVTEVESGERIVLIHWMHEPKE